MLDYFAIFTKGGALLWAWQLGVLRVPPLLTSTAEAAACAAGACIQTGR